MGFMPNDGDIILDAVLTDTGRMRLAKGDGSFKISKFALSDDEIDYSLYDKNNTSGSAYYDLTVLQTPVLEAFTNNTSNMKSKLISINRNDILYLPVLDLYTTAGKGSAKNANGTFNIAVDKNTVDTLVTPGTGILNGFKPNDDASRIELHQGLNTTELSKEQPLSRDLIEVAYIVEIDNRFGAIFPPPGAVSNTTLETDTQTPAATPSFIDDDNIAFYYFTLRNTNGFVSNLGGTEDSSIGGPRGTKISFRIMSSLELRTSDYLFTQLGTLASTALTNDAGTNLAASEYRFIDTTVRITGVNTGYRVDVPVRLVRAV